jgi:sortase A
MPSSEVYDQPDAPKAETEEEISTLLETKLKGYSVIARLDIENLSLSLPVLSETSEKALEVSVCYYIGPELGGEGNLVITGHNYRNGAHFGRLNELTVGDRVTVTDKEGNASIYTVYKTELIKPDEVEALQETEYGRELTLMTCGQNGNRRLLVRCVLEGME